jgi:hypothetical protein
MRHGNTAAGSTNPPPQAAPPPKYPAFFTGYVPPFSIAIGVPNQTNNSEFYLKQTSGKILPPAPNE